MQPFQTTNYGYQQPNYYMGQQNPYMDARMANLQQFQQSLQQPMMQQQMPVNGQQNYGIQGKIVDSIEAVKATDIPMDGNMYYFPKADGTEIYSKRWLQNGQTQILAFKPSLGTEVANSSLEDKSTQESAKFVLTEALEQYMVNIVERLDKLEGYIKPTTGSKKKEVPANE